jgi:quinol monooxygenase YgiN
MLAPSRAEPGNLRYDLWRDPAEPGRFVLDELYRDADAIAAHKATPHFQSYLSRINDLAERTAWVLAPVGVA